MRRAKNKIKVLTPTSTLETGKIGMIWASVFSIFWLFLVFSPDLAYSETKTTSNLLVNSDFETGNFNGWEVEGQAQVLNDCCQLNNVPSNYDAEFGVSGSINQSVNLTSDTITQQMLDQSPITLSSVVEVQNGECTPTNSNNCWGGSGQPDLFVIQLQIRDSSNNVLSSVRQERYDTTGIQGAYFDNSVTYSGTGANIGNIFIKGEDSNNAYLGAGNVDNISLVLQYDDEVLSTTQIEELTNTFEEIEEVVNITKEFVPEQIEEILLEEKFIQELVVEIYPEIIEIKEEEKILQEETIILALEEEIKVEESKAEIMPEEINSEPIEEVEKQIEEEIIEQENTEAVSPEDSCVGCEENNNVASSDEITIDDISAAVEAKIESIDKQMSVTQSIVSNLLKKTQNINSFQINHERFFSNQIKLAEINIDDYINKTYVDDRIIYKDVNFSDDLLYQHNKDITDLENNKIRAEQNLRRIINGF